MSRLLVRLYPAAWQARYGEEFELILAERPLGPFDVADIVLGALDARLHPRLARQAAPGKGFSMSMRIGGVAALVGGVLWPLGYFIANLGDAWIGLGGAIHVAGSIGLLVALVGISAFQARRHPVSVWAAFLLPAVGSVATMVGMSAMLTLGDRPLAGEVTGWYLWFIGLIATLAGSAIFGAISYRVRSVARSAATLLTVGPILAFLSLGAVSTGLANPPFSILVAACGLLVFTAGWVGMGIEAVRLDRPAAGPRAA